MFTVETEMFTDETNCTQVVYLCKKLLYKEMILHQELQQLASFGLQSYSIYSIYLYFEIEGPQLVELGPTGTKMGRRYCVSIHEKKRGICF